MPCWAEGRRRWVVRAGRNALLVGEAEALGGAGGAGFSAVRRGGGICWCGRDGGARHVLAVGAETVGWCERGPYRERGARPASSVAASASTSLEGACLSNQCLFIALGSCVCSTRVLSARSHLAGTRLGEESGVRAVAAAGLRSSMESGCDWLVYVRVGQCGRGVPSAVGA